MIWAREEINCIHSVMRVRLRESSLHAPPPGCPAREFHATLLQERDFFSSSDPNEYRHDNAHAAPTAKAEDLDDAAAPSALPLCNGANGCYPARRRRRLSASPFTR